jgi:hypothetical protein
VHGHVFITRGSLHDADAHPTTAMLADHQTILAAWNPDHGGHVGSAPWGQIVNQENVALNAVDPGCPWKRTRH